MAKFIASLQDLEDSTSYELDALEFLRATALQQNEAPNGLTSMTLGDLTPDGKQRTHTKLVLCEDMSGPAVIAALGRMRPLAFSAAFKLHDMMVTWILGANGSSAWQFNAKLKAHDELTKAGNLIEPVLFVQWPALSKAFWASYRHLVQFRNVLAHTGGVAIRGDGTLEISKGPNTLALSPEQQASYIRTMCIITRKLIAQAELVAVERQLVENDLAVLRLLHNHSSFAQRQLRFESLCIRVPLSMMSAEDPVRIEIDFDFVRATMEDHFPCAASGVLFYSVSVEADDGSRQLRWVFPPEAVPTGKVTLSQNTALIEAKTNLP